MEQSERTKAKLEENTILLMNDLQKIFGNLDKQTLEEVSYLIYCALAWMADDVLLQALQATQGNLNAESSSKY
jgi:hypothetical protein